MHVQISQLGKVSRYPSVPFLRKSIVITEAETVQGEDLARPGIKPLPCQICAVSVPQEWTSLCFERYLNKNTILELEGLHVCDHM